MILTKDQKKAILVIKNYLNVNGNYKYTDDYMLLNFELAIEELIETSNAIKTIKPKGVKSKSEGNQSMTFESNIEAWSITDNVKVLLPKPLVKLMG